MGSCLHTTMAVNAGVALQRLNLSHNCLSGALGSAILTPLKGLVDLVHLDCSYNELTAGDDQYQSSPSPVGWVHIPKEFEGLDGVWPRLQSLSLRGNPLSAGAAVDAQDQTNHHSPTQPRRATAVVSDADGARLMDRLKLVPFREQAWPLKSRPKNQHPLVDRDTKQDLLFLSYFCNKQR